MCKTAEGCWAEDLASDASLTDFVERFVLARRIYDENQIGEILLRELAELGLTEDLDLFMKLEVMYLNHQDKERKRQQLLAGMRG